MEPKRFNAHVRRVRVLRELRVAVWAEYGRAVRRECWRRWWGMGFLFYVLSVHQSYCMSHTGFALACTCITFASM